ncbi:hypothetical protein STEG23_002550 [Scotinomys teguina]
MSLPQHPDIPTSAILISSMKISRIEEANNSSEAACAVCVPLEVLNYVTSAGPLDLGLSFSKCLLISPGNFLSLEWAQPPPTTALRPPGDIFEKMGRLVSEIELS